MIKTLALALLLIQTPDALKGLESAMKTGNAKELVKHFNSTVELKIDGERASYSRNQAEMVLRKFFQKNPARGFFYVHNGSSPNGLKYTIGQYTTVSGTYRMVMLLKNEDGKYMVDTMRITKDDTLESGNK